MAYLKYDTDMIESARTEYISCVEEMESLKTSMENMVKDVRNAWKSEAGDAFFDKYDNEWLKGFTQYTEVLSHMADNLAMAGRRYTEITDKANALKIT